ncbi:hypothetical protein MDAP_000108 [Mitosporidium daphniae]|uniref:tRNA(Ile)-lysidine synthetase n=1 Tax=Mitosporidium daphniae TaxID=1485682 RepID=A0A098VVT9_9MICR|nr:uncharacterized protein DI09_11p90 [Mitosporidium daphniae]KGG52964.1 hypothetical protein DI09_11p90 [Mitosporidium daphniae]|eukprot:XP_013239433.1 uncharacterized protein DI09_11p90 [Mitosporidium daphniae]
MAVRGYRVVEHVESFVAQYCFTGARRDPISIQEYQTMFGRMLAAAKIPANSPNTKVGVALSGGPDSMALLGLTVAALGRERVVALTVTHGPPEDGGEPTSMIQDLVRPLGVQHILLPLNNLLPHANAQTKSLSKDLQSAHSKVIVGKGSVQQRCREMRYAALRDTALSSDLSLILCAHHLDDDLCTYFMRLSRYSGMEGLAGMRPLSILSGTPVTSRQLSCLEDLEASGVPPLMLGRPLLGFPKIRLVSTCGALGLDFLEDLSNSHFENSLRNSVREGIQTLLKSSPVSISDLYALMESAKKHREELRRQLRAAATENLFAATRNGEGRSWPWVSGNFAASPSAVIALPLHQRWWRNSGLLMRVLSLAAEGVGGTHLASSQTTLLAFSEAIVASALIRTRQAKRQRSQPTIMPQSAHHGNRTLLADSKTQPSSGYFEDLRISRTQKLPFIRAFSFGRCVVSPLGAIEASRRNLVHVGGPLLGITPAPRMPEHPSAASISPERRMVDNLLLVPGNIYLWDGRIQIYLPNDQPTVQMPLQILSESVIEETRPGPLTGMLARAGGLPAIRVSQRTFQEPQMLWVLSPALGPTGPAVKKIDRTESILDNGGILLTSAAANSAAHNPADIPKGQIDGPRVRIVPLTLAALRWLAAGASRNEPEKLSQMEAIRQCHTADALLQHPLVIAMDGSWAAMPTLALTLGQIPWSPLVHAVPVGVTHVINRLLLPSML